MEMCLSQKTYEYDCLIDARLQISDEIVGSSKNYQMFWAIYLEHFAQMLTKINQ